MTTRKKSRSSARNMMKGRILSMSAQLNSAINSNSVYHNEKVGLRRAQILLDRISRNWEPEHPLNRTHIRG